EIKAAVNTYRSYIARHNRRVLKVFDRRVDCFLSVLGRDLRTFVLALGDILKHYDELALRYDLEGCGEPLLISDEDVSHRELYFSYLESALKGKCLEEVRDRNPAVLSFVSLRST
ncbi:hypothetical protein CSPAE12_06554, partial [Colletotrichum incanum]